MCVYKQEKNMKAPFRQSYEVIDLIGGYAVALSNHREIVSVYDTLLDAHIARLQLEQGIEDKAAVWVIDDSRVTEPRLAGAELGHAGEYPLENQTILRLTQRDLDELLEIHRTENGSAPH